VTKKKRTGRGKHTIVDEREKKGKTLSEKEEKELRQAKKGKKQQIAGKKKKGESASSLCPGGTFPRLSGVENCGPSREGEVLFLKKRGMFSFCGSPSERRTKLVRKGKKKRVNMHSKGGERLQYI